jgi:transcriptional regulator with XRE-family HTH domain
MLNQEELLQTPNYLLTKYQSEIYRQLIDYMEKGNLTQTDMAKKLNVSNSYISQILNGRFNFTLKKLIELGLAIGKIPVFEFIDKEKYWDIENRRNYNFHIPSDIKTTAFSPLQYS